MAFSKFYLDNEKKIYFVLLSILSLSINQYYGYQGICPIDSFWFFNSGYDILNGHYPFKDYWTIAGPFIGFVQAFIFKILGVSWFNYVLHASLFNFILAISTFYILLKFNLSIKYSFFYSLLTSLIAYPSTGTPYVDHHASILSITSIYCLLLAFKTNKNIYWFLLPIILFISFLTKQAPTGHVFLIIVFLLFFYFIFNFNIKKIAFIFLGSSFIIVLFYLILFNAQITLISFFEQYILFPISIGKVRIENFLFPLEFSRIFLRFKLIHFALIIPIIVIYKNLKNDFKYIYNIEFFTIIALIGLSYALIVHQLMTINGMYIFFIIPILVGFSHVYYNKYYRNKKYILPLLLILAFCSTAHYGYKYIHKRDFMDLRKANMKNSIDAGVFDVKLKGLNWTSCFFPNNQKKEVDLLSSAIKIIKNDKRNKSIITDYQFISVILSSYDHSSSHVWFINHVVNQNPESRFYKKYKDLFINNLKKNKIQIAYVVKPLWGGNDVFEKGLNSNCYKKVKLTEIMDAYIILNCNELN